MGDRERLQRAVLATLDHLTRIGIHRLPVGRPEAVARAGVLPAEEVNVAASAPASPAPASAADASGRAPESRPSEASEGGSQSRRNVLPKPPPRSVERRDRFASVTPVQGGGENYGLPVLDRDQRTEQLQEGANRVRGCTRCAELAANRKQTVYGEGDPEARICFFGEGPGAEEDRSGRPFVGAAGKLLTKMIEACTFQREDVYILNTVKCRPPRNRNPEPQEVDHCREYFEHQLEVIQPEYIVCLGLVAARALLNTTASVGRLRGVFHRYRSSKVIVTYHPAYLLRNPDAKRATWEDLQRLMRDMGIEPPAAKRK